MRKILLASILCLTFLFFGCNNNTKQKGEMLLKDGEKLLRSKDFTKANKCFLEACELNNGEACWHLGFQNEFGLSKTKTDEFAALKYYEKACDNKYYMACWNLGLMYDSCKANTNNEELAYKLYKKACDGKYASSCTTLGIKYEENKNGKEKAKEYYKLGCDFGDNHGCLKLKYLEQNLENNTN